FANGLPVVATPVSAIPDYLRDEVEVIFAEPRNSADLADKIAKLIDWPEPRRQRLIENSQAFLARRVGVEATMAALWDTWSGYEVDIFLVTHNTPKYEDRAETFEIIERLFARTTTAFTLTVVDNASDDDFRQELVERVK